ncbi:DUF4998 domain-containing protein [Sphingobacterium sp. UT-1RO-CII-1]|uniref:DUF4998 domain-containing protein n=1 Tax=Sphingobacterium sp. UT-1RO-CII-1 TaxID=2995225 RepID=UPI00227B6FC3|nr:DUF4998 domain-containing protein [Sphingobacterium sp. UT-1RO-CII-1]MCY4779149.1 DUF4998 domain-containing protein [Sphingobacterium sp. UT-1RO-CII-1]
MKNIIRLYCIMVMLSCLGACTDAIDPLQFGNSGEVRYAGKAKEASYAGGENRLKIEFLLGPDPNISKAIVFWNLRKDSVLIEIERENLQNNRVSTIIDNLPENVYNFEIYTYDKYGNRSVPVYLTGRTFGSRYATILNNRKIADYEVVDERGDIKILWADSVLSSFQTKVVYENNMGQEKTVIVGNKENTVLLEAVNTERNLKLITQFLPESAALDTFQSIVDFALDPLKLVMELPKPYAAFFVDGFDPPNSGGFSVLWDGRWGKTFSQTETSWASEAGWGSVTVWDPTSDGTGDATWLTLDLGSSVRVGRYRTGLYWPYYDYCPMKTELWAYTGKEAPQAKDGWNNWVKIGEVDNSSFLKTEADMVREYPNGDNIYTDPAAVPSARYYRVKCIENWNSDPRYSKVSMSFSEVTFWKLP